MDTYKKEAIFSDSLEEFDNSRETVQSLIEEYTAAEKENYLDWGTNEDVNENDWVHHFYGFIFYLLIDCIILRGLFFIYCFLIYSLSLLLTILSLDL